MSREDWLAHRHQLRLARENNPRALLRIGKRKHRSFVVLTVDGLVATLGLVAALSQATRSVFKSVKRDDAVRRKVSKLLARRHIAEAILQESNLRPVALSDGDAKYLEESIRKGAAQSRS